jgi:predicted nucleic acid-binding Zn ribbon protein
MKIVMTYDVSDGCTYSYTKTYCFDAYDSVKQAEEEFFTLCESSNTFIFVKKDFCSMDFYTSEGNYTEPKFQELNDWFEYNKH